MFSQTAENGASHERNIAPEIRLKSRLDFARSTRGYNFPESPEAAEDRQRHDLPDDLENLSRCSARFPSNSPKPSGNTRRTRCPSRENHQPERLLLELQMPMPCERHEDVRAGKKNHEKPPGLKQIIHAHQKWRPPTLDYGRTGIPRSPRKRFTSPTVNSPK